MGAQMRVYRQRIRSIQATKKITGAMELIAASRVVQVRRRTMESAPYIHALTRAVSALATYSHVEHPLTTERDRVRRAAVVLVTSDRGLAGAYSSTILKEGESLISRLEEEGKEVVVYLVGRKAIAFYTFRRRGYAAEWSGQSDSPTFELAREIAERVVADFLADYEAGGHEEVHVVYTRFNSMVDLEPRVLRMLPIEIVEGEAEPGPGQAVPLYEFEPSADAVLDILLPRYVTSRINTCLLSAATSELASRQRAMKSATDNADALIKTYTRLSNQARQAEITQEISEIVGGAEALTPHR